ncbi:MULTISPECIES: dienelactone hydrolase family protein [unclassified Rhizobium]|jgi:dienelactone hydrolase|uniref:dienelactone hydrolase family protein n=1 Tax=unclassified Rhizobium TaxID=2613769 RepID=UPI000648F9E1|nr:MULTISPECIES: dienelactone hydrolase family protein [unclassified Rhizobium]MBN8949376.1 dienelactone hydrolase family protein [Rhizobium tropici]OJY75174.1 MAG: alpha/beta hydrolase [Rhizobium sp. 60-20]RKD70840.1 dienelactone hydrolase [Rhizobium sp. WW_1]
MQVTFALVLTVVSLLAFGNAEAGDRERFTVATAGGNVLVEGSTDSASPSRPAVIILSGSKGFASPAYDDFGRSLDAAGLDAYFVHLLSPVDEQAIAHAGSARARIAYYATRRPAWIATVHKVISHLNSEPDHIRRIGVLGISLGAQTAAAASAGATDIGALVLVDGAFPEGYSKPVSSLPPLLIVWGGADRTFPISTAQTLRQMAQGLDGSVSLDVHKGGAHDFFLKPGAQATAAQRGVIDFFVSQLSK